MTFAELPNHPLLLTMIKFIYFFSVFVYLDVVPAGKSFTAFTKSSSSSSLQSDVEPADSLTELLALFFSNTKNNQFPVKPYDGNCRYKLVD